MWFATTHHSVAIGRIADVPRTLSIGRDLLDAIDLTSSPLRPKRPVTPGAVGVLELAFRGGRR